MFRKILGLNLALIGLGIFAGCVVDGPENQADAPIETQTDVKVDPDNSYKKALGLFFDLKVDESIDFNGQDSEDWRYIIVPEAGLLTLNLSLDTPNGVNGTIKIQDAQERAQRTLVIEDGKGFYQIADLDVTQGIYYFQIMVTKGASTYTVGAEFKSRPTQPVLVADNTPTPEPPAPVTDEKTKPKPKPKPKPDENTDKKTKPAPPPKPEPVAEPVVTKKVTGFISLITPKPDGSAEVTIRDVGKNKGVEAGAVGNVEGTKMKLKTTQCFPTSCRAVIPESADPKSIKQGANVTFSVK